MLYDIMNKQEIQEEEAHTKGFLLGVYTPQEWQKRYEALNFSSQTWLELSHMEETRTLHKLDSYYGYCFGYVHTWNEALDHLDQGIALYCRKQEIYLISEQPHQLEAYITYIKQLDVSNISLEHLLSLLLEDILRPHKAIHDALEDAIEELDHAILQDELHDFNRRSTHIRNQIRLLQRYDEQLEDVCEELLEDENDLFEKDQLHHLRILADRVDRLVQNTRLLRDYSVQVRESYQAQVDIHLNRMMYLFTIVTVIFLPLTLIVGWYGMNFTHMPELSWTYGYPFVIVLSLVSALICIWYMHKKRLL